MSSNWIRALDLCAETGILDYSGLTEPPIAVNIPAFPNNNINNNNIQQPQIDEFTPNNNENLVKNPTWEKWLFGGILATGIASLLLLASKGKFSGLTSKLCTKVKDIGTKTLDLCKAGARYVKDFFSNIIKKIKKTP